MQKPLPKTVLVLLALLTPSLVLGHEDDPKARDRQPPYRGPGFRAAFQKGPDLVFPSQGVNLHAWLTLPEFGEEVQLANDCWGYVSPTGREYALLGLSVGTAFVEITDPSNPAIVSIQPGPHTIWRDIKTFRQYAFAVCEGGQGIQVFDLALIDQGEVSLVNIVLGGGDTSTHNVAVNEASGFLYRCGGGENGLRIYDLADPANPAFVGDYPDRYVHDAQVVTFENGPYAGKEIAFCAAGFNKGSVMSGLTILDVTDKTQIATLAHLEYSNAAYAHQGWLSPDRNYFYIGDEGDESVHGFSTRTTIIDVRNLSDPREVGSFGSGLNATDHNLFTKGKLIYEANYRSGLRVFDASDPLAPVEVAFFDTYPDDDEVALNGIWAAYPYFPSGTVIGSDFEKGLFVWSLQESIAMVDEPRLLFPWISNSETFESTLIVQNLGEQPAKMTFSARRLGGEMVETSEELEVPGLGFREFSSADLFPELGMGAGYSVVVSSVSQQLTGRWVTNDRVAQSPSQGLAVVLSENGKTNDRLGRAVEFGFLPGTGGFQSAPVVVHSGDGPATITVYYFNKEGELVATDTLANVAPFIPVVPRFLGPEDENLRAVAYSPSANLTGAAFVFNLEGQTAIGNTAHLPDFTPPVIVVQE